MTKMNKMTHNSALEIDLFLLVHLCNYTYCALKEVGVHYKIAMCAFYYDMSYVAYDVS